MITSRSSKCLLLCLVISVVVEFSASAPPTIPEDDDLFIDMLMKSIQSETEVSTDYTDVPKDQDSSKPTPTEQRKPSIFNRRYRFPLVEIYLLNGQPTFQTENKNIKVEYNCSDKKKSSGSSNTQATEYDVKKDENNQADKDQTDVRDPSVPVVEFRNIITAPTFCPPGERQDSNGVCRRIM